MQHGSEKAVRSETAAPRTQSCYNASRKLERPYLQQQSCYDAPWRRERPNLQNATHHRCGFRSHRCEKGASRCEACFNQNDSVEDFKIHLTCYFLKFFENHSTISTAIRRDPRCNFHFFAKSTTRLCKRKVPKTMSPGNLWNLWKSLKLTYITCVTNIYYL